MEIFDKAGPLGETLKGGGGLKNPIKNFSNVEGALEEFAEAGQSLLGALFKNFGAGGSTLEYPLDVSGNPAYAATVSFQTLEYTTPESGKSQKSHMKQQEDNLKQARLKEADDARNQAAGLGQVDDFGSGSGRGNRNSTSLGGGGGSDIGVDLNPVTVSVDTAERSSVSGTAAFADDTAALNFSAKKDSEVEAATAKKSSSTVRAGTSFFPKKGEPTVTMYFPPSMAFVDNVAYDTNAELGVLGASTLAGMEGGMSGLGSAANAIKGEGKALVDTFLGRGNPGEGVSEGVTDALKLAVAKVNNRFNPSSSFRNAATLANRFIVNPNVRAIFRGVNIREFQFQFKLIATSPDEARTIQKIIKHFRKELYPRGFPVNFGSASADIGYHFPNAFKIIFKFQGRRNKNLPKIKPCYLRSFNATINPTGGSFRNDGQPNEIDISMAFVEHETLKSLDVQKGF